MYIVFTGVVKVDLDAVSSVPSAFSADIGNVLFLKLIGHNYQDRIEQISENLYSFNLYVKSSCVSNITKWVKIKTQHSEISHQCLGKWCLKTVGPWPAKPDKLLPTGTQTLKSHSHRTGIPMVIGMG